MKQNLSWFLGLSLLSDAASARAQVISPLTTFGNDGWLAPGGAYAYLTSGNGNERGLAYGNSHLYLVSRDNVNGSAVNVRILDPATGADLGGLNTSGISGGTFSINMAAVDGDGALYVANLTTQATTTPFTIYRWATESAVPVVAYSGTPLAGGRVGDTLAVTGSGSGTRLVAGFSNNPNVAGNNGYAIIDPNTHTATQVAFSGTPPNAGDFRLGLTFTDSTHVIGTQGSGTGASFLRYTSYSGSSGTLLGSPSPVANSERLLAYAIVGGIPLLAAGSTTDAHVSLYDLTDPVNPVLLGSANNTVSPAANSHNVGELAWGPVSGDTATLYALSADQGVQAFVVVVPEPQPLLLGVFGLALLTLGKRSRR